MEMFPFRIKKIVFFCEKYKILNERSKILQKIRKKNFIQNVHEKDSSKIWKPYIYGHLSRFITKG